MSGSASAPNLAQSSAELGQEVQRVRTAMKRAVETAGVKNDPTLTLLETMSDALVAQWELHDQSVQYFRSTSDRPDKQYADTMEQAEKVLAAKREAIIEGLVPKLAETVQQSVRSWNRTVTLKTTLVYGGVAVSLAFGIGMAGFGAGWQEARQAAINDKITIDKAMGEQGLDGQAALAEIISMNNLSGSWARCKNDVVTTTDGRKACRMLLWSERLPRDPKEKGAG
jgi:hypothetical protein